MIDGPWGFVQEQLQGNQLFQGGLILGIFGVLLAWGRSIPALLLRLAQRRLITTYEVRPEDYVYEALMSWLSRHEYTRRTKWLLAKCRFPGVDELGREVSPDVGVEPAPGNHLIRYGGHYIWVKIEREKMNPGGGSVIIGFHQEVHLRSISRKAVHGLLQEATRSTWILEKKEGTRVYVFHHGGAYWDTLYRAAPSRLESVILDGNTRDAVQVDLERFLASREWYQQRSIPWRRGYMFHGPPGTGKTKLAMALASHSNMDLAVMSIPDEMNDSQLATAVHDAPSSAALIFEDLDRVLGRKNSKVTMAGLLNCLDGTVSREGRVVFMTTNHIDDIDEALLRPGRIDHRLHLGYTTPDQARKYYRVFFPGAHDALAEQFATWAGSGPWTMAQLQSHLMLHADDAEAASQSRPEEVEA